MTISVLAIDEKTGRIGGAAATGSLCVGGWVLRGHADSGMSASQGTAPSTLWGEEVLVRMSAGAAAADAAERRKKNKKGKKAVAPAEDEAPAVDEAVQEEESGADGDAADKPAEETEKQRPPKKKTKMQKKWQ